VRSLRWTLRARADLAGIQSFIRQDSPHFASVVVSRLIAATDRLPSYPESGRVVPELARSDIRELIHAPYRIVYRLVGADQIHVLTVHHGARKVPRLL
jgi:plasmid stabilization system protein ParE